LLEIDVHIETKQKLITAREGASLLMCIATLRDGLSIVTYPRRADIARSRSKAEQFFIRFKGRKRGFGPFDLLTYLERIGKMLSDSPSSVRQIRRDDGMFQMALRILDQRRYREASHLDANDRGPFLAEIGTGSVRFRIQEILEKIFGKFNDVLRSTSNLTSDTPERFFDEAKEILTGGDMTRLAGRKRNRREEIAAGMLVIGGIGLEDTLSSILATGVQVTHKRTAETSAVGLPKKRVETTRKAEH
jgi:hypothetical protein